MQILKGKVISKKMDKTATVLVERMTVHPLYNKRFKRNKKYQVQDEMNTLIGQEVTFTASKPYSKTKKWKIVGTIENKKEPGRSKK
jgi:small subunit ribosomal protein S17